MNVLLQNRTIMRFNFATILFCTILIFELSCTIKKKVPTSLSHDDRIPILDKNGQQKIDVHGNPMYRYPDPKIKVKNLDFSYQEPDCDSLNGSIAVIYPDMNEHFYIEWYDENNIPLQQYANQFKLDNLGIGTYRMRLGNRNGCMNYGEKLVGKLSGTDYEIYNRICNNTEYTNLLFRFKDSMNPYTLEWQSLTQTDTVFESFQIKAKLGEHFEFLIKNSRGCSRWEDLTIEGSNCEDSYKIKLKHMKPSPREKNLGALEIEIDTLSTNPHLLENYSIEWDKYDEEAKYENIYPGEYCVTITNLSENNFHNCRTVQCFTVEEKLH